MASENIEDWDVSLPSSSSTLESETNDEDYEDQMYKANIEKLQKYVKQMAYRPVTPPTAKGRLEELSKPKKLALVGTYSQYGRAMSPKLRRQRMKRLAGKYAAISTEQLEQIIKGQKAKERKKEDLMKRKQELYYEMLTKLERQCRTQYLNVLLKKFATFIAKLATTMTIPQELADPYSRMQRGIFCNILLAIGVQPASQAALYYNNEEAKEYETCHKLAHALLSLIIKALDTASTKNPVDIQPQEVDFEMDNYIKDRLMCAAEKKLLNARNQKKAAAVVNPLTAIFKKCKDFSENKC